MTNSENMNLGTDGQHERNLDFGHDDCRIEMSEGFEVKTQKKVYSRKELEGLRHVGVDWQKKRWAEIYCGLGPVVQQEYDDRLVGDDRNHQYNNQKRKKSFPEDGNGKFPTEQEYVDDDSDEDYSSLMKPAFQVSGEPDFDSGPPEDGLEFLRRVRWEAAQVPQVKVAKVDTSKFKEEQTNYMPQIPNFAKCSEKLMPLKEWEDAFLTEFEDLRMALSRYGASEGQFQSSSSKLSECILLENFDLTSCEGDSCQSMPYCISQVNDIPDCFSVAVDNHASNSVESSGPKPSERGASVEQPTLSTIIKMDSVARVSALKKRINMAESKSILSWNDCLWLFALSAAVDTPLDADTCASFRSLLRKCASLRAEKSVVDEEVAMLNILATIAGRYFGQLGNSNP